MKREELLRSREYWLINIQNDVFNLIENYRKKKQLNQTQLAQELGYSKGYISQILNGDFDYKVSKLVELSLAFNKVPIVSFIDLEKYIKEDEEDLPHYLDNRHIPKSVEYNIYKHDENVFSGTELVGSSNRNTGSTLFTQLSSL